MGECLEPCDSEVGTLNHYSLPFLTCEHTPKFVFFLRLTSFSDISGFYFHCPMPSFKGPSKTHQTDASAGLLVSFLILVFPLNHFFWKVFWLYTLTYWVTYSGFRSLSESESPLLLIQKWCLERIMETKCIYLLQSQCLIPLVQHFQSFLLKSFNIFS